MAQVIKKNPSMMHQLKKSGFLKDVKEDVIQSFYDFGIVRIYKRGESVLEERKKSSARVSHKLGSGNKGTTHKVSMGNKCTILKVSARKGSLTI